MIYAVELDPIIIAALGEVEKIGGGHRNLGGEEGALDRATVRFHDDAADF